ncbi:Vasohibin-domain-containing protein [Catenaria anguillulae PL171]|uniref:Vasohibin-domain-containing protein n=1 Tax=Catenaria anguillulae PL171 TaxID=765915 RepID=A0A1Y2I4I3_9FUNG|nr:Vasohibin-domain-containing protein [Catenaria anguillulae PL171]
MQQTRFRNYSHDPAPATHALDSLSIISWIQRRLNSLGYNHLPGNPFFTINKRASARALGHVAASMFAAGLPIKCLEAVVLSMWLISEVLPAGISSVPIAFKSIINLPECELPGTAAGKQYRHIVLAVAHHSSSAVAGESGEVWGALGLSRRKDLMNKLFQYKSLADLIDEYLLAWA